MRYSIKELFYAITFVALLCTFARNYNLFYEPVVNWLYTTEQSRSYLSDEQMNHWRKNVPSGKDDSVPDVGLLQAQKAN